MTTIAQAGHDAVAGLKPVLSLREKLGYGSGDVGFNLLFDMGQLYLLKFFVDALGINPAIAGSIFLVAKIWDAFADVAVGTWVDNRTKIGKRGKYRAFIFYATIPLALMMIASFQVPDFSLTGRTIWAFVIYMLFGTVYSLANIPYGALVPAITRNLQERAVLSSLRQGGGTLGLLISTVAFWPIVNAFADKTQGYTVAVTVFAIGGSVMIYVMYANVKERFVGTSVSTSVGEAKATRRVPLSKQYRLLLSNRPLLGLCAANLFIFSAFNVRLAMQVFFTQYNLGDTWALSFIGLFSIAWVFPGVAVTPWLTKHIGKRQTYILGLSIWFVADFLAFFVVNDTVSLVVLSSFTFFGSALPNSLNWAMVSDTVEYGQWKTGIRSEALTYSAFTWFRKLSQAIAGFVPGVVLALVAYVPNAAQQSEVTLFSIRALMFLYPLAMIVLATASMWFVYNLTDKHCVEIQQELSGQRTRKEAGDTAGATDVRETWVEEK
jgi:GPH family glycoside/pentoside/hexuronide:cation symporter